MEITKTFKVIGINHLPESAMIQFRAEDGSYGKLGYDYPLGRRMGFGPDVKDGSILSLTFTTGECVENSMNFAVSTDKDDKMYVSYEDGQPNTRYYTSVAKLFAIGSPLYDYFGNFQLFFRKRREFRRLLYNLKPNTYISLKVG